MPVALGRFVDKIFGEDFLVEAPRAQRIDLVLNSRKDGVVSVPPEISGQMAIGIREAESPVRQAEHTRLVRRLSGEERGATG
jgi:hypothetical protein